MIPVLVFATVQPAPQPVVIERPAVVVYQSAPRPFAGLFAPRPQVLVIQGQCAGGSCPK